MGFRHKHNKQMKCAVVLKGKMGVFKTNASVAQGLAVRGEISEITALVKSGHGKFTSKSRWKKDGRLYLHKGNIVSHSRAINPIAV